MTKGFAAVALASLMSASLADIVNRTTVGVRAICDSIHQLECYGDDLPDGHIQNIKAHMDCCNACESKAGCNAWTWNWKTSDCYLKSACTDKKTDDDAKHSGYNPTPAPSPTPPTPAPSPTPPTPDNPLGIKPLPNRSDNFFLIIGDWGAPTDASWAHSTGGCQREIAQMMKDYVKKYEAQGKKCLFIGAVGDNFYAAGLQDDAHWKKQWGDVYGTSDQSSALYDIPWLGVLGNHDIGNDDPDCACKGVCKQFNNAKRPSGTEKFWMPDFYWHYYIPGVELEIIGLDTNAFDVDGIGGDGCEHGGKIVCDRCGGRNNVAKFLNTKKSAGESYLDNRARSTSAKTALIMQHYNWVKGVGNVGDMYKKRFESNNDGKTNVLSAYGHAHDQKCEGSRDRGCDVIMTGGGGGWKGGGYFGFTAVHLTDDGAYQTTLETSEVRISQRSCSYLLEPVNSTGYSEVFV